MAHLTVTSDHDPWSLVGLKLTYAANDTAQEGEPFWAGKCSCGWDLNRDTATDPDNDPYRTIDLRNAVEIAGAHVDNCRPDRGKTPTDLPARIAAMIEAVAAVDEGSGVDMVRLLDGTDVVATLVVIRGQGWPPAVTDLLAEHLGDVHVCERCRQVVDRVDPQTSLCRVCDHHDDDRVVI